MFILDKDSWRVEIDWKTKFNKWKNEDINSCVYALIQISPTKPNVTTHPSHPYIYMYVIHQHLDHKL